MDLDKELAPNCKFTVLGFQSQFNQLTVKLGSLISGFLKGERLVNLGVCFF